MASGGIQGKSEENPALFRHSVRCDGSGSEVIALAAAESYFIWHS
jgi:hypothetical protein